MRIGIRTKLIFLLVAVALLPLLVALLTIVIGGRQLRDEIFGQNILSLAHSDARVMQVELQSDVRWLKVTLQERLVLDYIQSVEREWDPAEREELDEQWASLDSGHATLQQVLANPVTDIIEIISREVDSIAEILITDRYGNIVAANRKPSDYYQADEEWWQEAVADGEGKIYIPYISYDESSKVWAVSLCFPLRRDGQIVGVVKAILALNRWLPVSARQVGQAQGSLLVIGADGYILHSREILMGEYQPHSRRLEDWEDIVTVDRRGDWRITPEKRIQAYAPIRVTSQVGDLPVVMSPWTLVLDIPLAESRRGLARLTMLMLFSGLFLIVALFLGGVLLIDRSLINRIRRIGRSARRVAEGELEHRANPRWAGTRVFGHDEIDDLARDFNNMVRRLQRSHVELTEANKLKENFIRIAGHELRTPVSYIVGMANLLKDSHDPDRLAKAIDTMGFKAGRLDEIIQAMFKLIPEKALSENLHLSEVDLSQMLETIYEDAQPWLERRDQTLLIDPGEGETKLYADEAKLHDIIQNLLMNAIKFTPNEGTVRIRVQRQLGGHVAIEVRDEGPGIPEADRPHIFEPFYSGSDTLKHSTGKSGYGKRGMGLGLAIVKHFVELHNGSIRFETSPEGSTFIVQLPIEAHQLENGSEQA